MTQPADRATPDPSGYPDDELRLLDFAIILAKRKLLVIGLPVFAAIAALLYTLTLPNIYTAGTKVLPPQKGQSVGGSLLAQLGGVAGLVGVGGAVGGSPNDLYISMLKSRTVQDKLVQRFDLLKRYGQASMTATRAMLESRTNILSGKDGILVIEVEDEDPKMSAALANAYVDALFELTHVLALTEASQKRLFFERQFTQAKDNLSKAEIAAREALSKGGLVKVDEQGRAMVEATARMRAQITLKEVQIGAMRSFAAENNPDLKMAQMELDVLKREIQKIEGTASPQTTDSAVPAKGMDNLRLLRDLRYYETIYELLAKQFEMAKIEEAKDSSVFQVIDTAIEPEGRSKPRRMRIVLVAGLLGFVLAVIWALIGEAIANSRNDPGNASRMEAFRRYLAWRRHT